MTLKFQPKPLESPDHHRFEVVADGLGRYVIDVSLPPGHAKGDAQYPVILVTDGNLLFDIAQVQVHGGFATASGVLPPSILVGVGYPADEGVASFYGRRNFDFHGPWEMTDALGKTLQRVFTMLKNADGKPDWEMRPGGYDRFMRFLRDELMPSLADRYSIDAAARHTLIGDSSGGHFVLRALYDSTSPFRRYICISPGFGSAENAIPKAEAEYAASHSDLDVDLFMCAGRVEIDQDPISALCRFGSGITWIAEQFALRQWPSARVHWEIMNNEDHTSIPQRALAAGLRSVHELRPGINDHELRKAAAASLEALRNARPGRAAALLSHVVVSDPGHVGAGRHSLCRFQIPCRATRTETSRAASLCAPVARIARGRAQTHRRRIARRLGPESAGHQKPRATPGVDCDGRAKPGRNSPSSATPSHKRSKRCALSLTTCARRISTNSVCARPSWR
jgi:predicted alpha/beta superfamily hydrolase